MWMENGAGEELGKQNIELSVLGDSDGKESACSAGDPGSIPGLEDPLEEGMSTHSNILAWRIPWTERPGGLHSPWGC